MEQPDNFMKTTTDSIKNNIAKGNYDTSLVLIDQLIKESHEISVDNQINHVNCLYKLKRYIDALEQTKNYIEKGNTSPEMLLLRGLIFQALEQYDQAITIFSQYPEWSKFLKKAQHLKSIQLKKDSIIRFSADPVTDQNFKLEWSQTHKDVSIFAYIGEILPHEYHVEFYRQSVDISIQRYNQKKFTRSIELSKKIIPRTSTCKWHPRGLEITMEKEIEEAWSSFEVHPSNSFDVSLDELLIKIALINDVPADKAIMQFQQIMDSKGAENTDALEIHLSALDADL